jgi:hypothetical protein
MKILWILSLIAMWPSVSCAELNRGDPSAYGIGVLTCPYASFMLGSECFRRLSWLKEPVRLYEKPDDNAEIAGTILDPEENLHGWQNFHFLTTGGMKKELDIIEVAYEEKAIVIHEKKGDWLRTGQGWIRGKDVRLNASTVFLTWDTVLSYQMMHGYMDEEGPYIGWFYPIADQYLYAAPDGKALGVFWSSSNRESRPDLLVLDRRENWIKVIIDSKGTTCDGRDQKPDGPTGWVRLINEDKNPMVYWYTRGC